MPELHDLLERRASGYGPPRDLFDRVLDRRRRRDRNRRIGTAVVALAVAAVAIGGLLRAISSGQAPAKEELGIFAPVAGRIVYVNEDEVGDVGYEPGLWAVDPAGPADTADGPSVAADVASTLVPLGLEDAEPLGWSSDGTELLFERMYGGLIVQQDLYVLHSDGSETLLVRRYGGSATISPDGTRVVFSGECGRRGLCVVDAGGGQPVPLPYPTEDAYSPTFSPDGTQIAYLMHGDDDLTHVWVADVEGSGAREILAAEETRSVGAGGLQWSPAGDRLAFGVRGFEGNGDVSSIYAFAPDGSDFTRLTTGGDPHWSPDGSQIAYTIDCSERQASCADGSIVLTLAIADADGSNVREFGFAVSGPWHPGAPVRVDEDAPPPSESFARADGEVLSFTGTSDAAGDLVAVDPRTGEERVLVEDLDTVSSARWSADGRWVAYETDGPQGIGLWVVGASQEPRLVATGASMLTWSSTGAEISMIRLTSPLHSNIAGSTLHTIDPVTGETTDVGSISDDVGDVTSAPAWSPDGTRFVFGARGGAIYSVDVRSGAHQLLVRLPGERLDSVDQTAWSPDGAHIAIVNDGKPGGTYVVDADGSNARVLLDGYNATGVAWSPDGTRLAYADPANPVVWVASMDGSAPAEIGQLSAPCDDPFFCQEDLTWSPDGSRIGLRNVMRGSIDESIGVSAIDADGRAEAEPIDDLTYRSWDGGWYSCECAPLNVGL